MSSSTLRQGLAKLAVSTALLALAGCGGGGGGGGSATGPSLTTFAPSSAGPFGGLAGAENITESSAQLSTLEERAERLAFSLARDAPDNAAANYASVHSLNLSNVTIGVATMTTIVGVDERRVRTTVTTVVKSPAAGDLGIGFTVTVSIAEAGSGNAGLATQNSYGSFAERRYRFRQRDILWLDYFLFDRGIHEFSTSTSVTITNPEPPATLPPNLAPTPTTLTITTTHVRVDDWIAAGVWLYAPERETDSDLANIEIGSFAYGENPFSNTSISFVHQNQTEILTSAATYRGSASGYYVRNLEVGTENDYGDLGVFQAAVVLAADFSESAANLLGTVRGEISGFSFDGSDSYGLVLQLRRAPITAALDGGFFRGDISSNNANGSTFTGRWSGRFFNTQTLPEDHPTSSAGTFAASALDIDNSGGHVSLTGVFGAWLDTHQFREIAQEAAGSRAANNAPRITLTGIGGFGTRGITQSSNREDPAVLDGRSTDIVDLSGIAATTLTLTLVDPVTGEISTEIATITAFAVSKQTNNSISSWQYTHDSDPADFDQLDIDSFNAGSFISYELPADDDRPLNLRTLISANHLALAFDQRLFGDRSNDAAGSRIRIEDIDLLGTPGTYLCDERESSLDPNRTRRCEIRNGRIKSGHWFFVPDQVNEWLAGGAWLTWSSSDYLKHEIGAFANGYEPYASNLLGAIAGSAVYDGVASGYYAEAFDTAIDGTFQADGGFYAESRLSADFGSAQQFGTISGTISRINTDTGGLAEFSGLTLTLAASLVTQGPGSFFDGSVNGTDESSGAVYVGQWGAGFFSRTTSAGYPESIAGTFGAATTSPDGYSVERSFIGTFFARIDIFRDAQEAQFDTMSFAARITPVGNIAANSQIQSSNAYPNQRDRVSDTVAGLNPLVEVSATATLTTFVVVKEGVDDNDPEIELSLDQDQLNLQFSSFAGSEPDPTDAEYRIHGFAGYTFFSDSFNQLAFNDADTPIVDTGLLTVNFYTIADELPILPDTDLFESTSDFYNISSVDGYSITGTADEGHITATFITITVDDSVRTLEGTLACLPDYTGRCEIADGRNVAGNWIFVPEEIDLRGWLAGGLWWHQPVDLGFEAEFIETGAFSDGDALRSGIASVEGTASYYGQGLGYYVTFSQTPDAEGRYGARGTFSSDIVLRAAFGNDSALGSISGSVNSIILDGAENFGGVIFLDSASIDSGVSSFSGDTSMSFNSTSYDGKWGGRFYGSGSDGFPNQVAGTFGAASTGEDSDGIARTFIGMYGTRIDRRLFLQAATESAVADAAGASVVATTRDSLPFFGISQHSHISGDQFTRASLRDIETRSNGDRQFRIRQIYGRARVDGVISIADSEPHVLLGNEGVIPIELCSHEDICTQEDVDGGVSDNVTSPDDGFNFEDLLALDVVSQNHGLYSLSGYRFDHEIISDGRITMNFFIEGPEIPLIAGTDVGDTLVNAPGASVNLFDTAGTIVCSIGAHPNGCTIANGVITSGDWTFIPDDLNPTYTTGSSTGLDDKWMVVGQSFYIPYDISYRNDTEVGVYSHGADPFPEDDIIRVAGTATYNGFATGYYARSYPSADRYGENGYFDGDVVLNADFGRLDTAGTISGTVSNIMLDAYSGSPAAFGGEVSLRSTSILAALGGAIWLGNTAMTHNGASYSGRWGGRFYGDHASDGFPDSATGTFGVAGQSADNDGSRYSLIGSFLSRIDRRAFIYRELRNRVGLTGFFVTPIQVHAVSQSLLHRWSMATTSGRNIRLIQNSSSGDEIRTIDFADLASQSATCTDAGTNNSAVLQSCTHNRSSSEALSHAFYRSSYTYVEPTAGVRVKGLRTFASPNERYQSTGLMLSGVSSVDSDTSIAYGSAAAINTSVAGQAGQLICDIGSYDKCEIDVGGTIMQGNWYHVPDSIGAGWLGGGLYYDLPFDVTHQFGSATMESFANGSTPYDQRDRNNPIGTAVYRGLAAGHYAYSYPSVVRQGDYGYFEGDVELTANFGTATSAGSISGSISNLAIDADSNSPDTTTFSGSSIALLSASIIISSNSNAGDFVAFATNAGFVRGNVTYVGRWGGRFFGNRTSADTHPDSVAGTFGLDGNAAESDGRRWAFIGTFGARADRLTFLHRQLAKPFDTLPRAASGATTAINYNTERESNSSARSLGSVVLNRSGAGFRVRMLDISNRYVASGLRLTTFDTGTNLLRDGGSYVINERTRNNGVDIVLRSNFFYADVYDSEVEHYSIITGVSDQNSGAPITGLSATYQGKSGTLACTKPDGSNCVITDGIVLQGEWSFTASGFGQGDWLAGGSWNHQPYDIARYPIIKGAYARGDSIINNAGNPSSGRAVYNGSAQGRYYNAYRERYSDGGTFTGDLVLNVDFAASNPISGLISNIVLTDSGAIAAPDLTLNSAQESGGIFTATVSSTGGATGRWGAQFFGDRYNVVPEAVSGTFSATLPLNANGIERNFVGVLMARVSKRSIFADALFAQLREAARDNGHVGADNTSANTAITQSSAASSTGNDDVLISDVAVALNTGTNVTEITAFELDKNGHSSTGIDWDDPGTDTAVSMLVFANDPSTDYFTPSDGSGNLAGASIHDMRERVDLNDAGAAEGVLGVRMYSIIDDTTWLVAGGAWYYFPDDKTDLSRIEFGMFADSSYDPDFAVDTSTAGTSASYGGFAGGYYYSEDQTEIGTFDGRALLRLEFGTYAGPTDNTIPDDELGSLTGVIDEIVIDGVASTILITLSSGSGDGFHNNESNITGVYRPIQQSNNFRGNVSSDLYAGRFSGRIFQQDATTEVPEFLAATFGAHSTNSTGARSGFFGTILGELFVDRFALIKASTSNVASTRLHAALAATAGNEARQTRSDPNARNLDPNKYASVTQSGRPDDIVEIYRSGSNQFAINLQSSTGFNSNFNFDTDTDVAGFTLENLRPSNRISTYGSYYRDSGTTALVSRNYQTAPETTMPHPTDPLMPDVVVPAVVETVNYYEQYFIYVFDRGDSSNNNAGWLAGGSMSLLPVQSPHTDILEFGLAVNGDDRFPHGQINQLVTADDDGDEATLSPLSAVYNGVAAGTFILRYPASVTSPPFSDAGNFVADVNITIDFCTAICGTPNVSPISGAIENLIQTFPSEQYFGTDFRVAITGGALTDPNVDAEGAFYKLDLAGSHDDDRNSGTAPIQYTGNGGLKLYGRVLDGDGNWLIRRYPERLGGTFAFSNTGFNNVPPTPTNDGYHVAVAGVFGAWIDYSPRFAPEFLHAAATTASKASVVEHGGHTQSSQAAGQVDLSNPVTGFTVSKTGGPVIWSYGYRDFTQHGAVDADAPYLPSLELSTIEQDLTFGSLETYLYVDGAPTSQFQSQLTDGWIAGGVWIYRPYQSEEAGDYQIGAFSDGGREVARANLDDPVNYILRVTQLRGTGLADNEGDLFVIGQYRGQLAGVAIKAGFDNATFVGAYGARTTFTADVSLNVNFGSSNQRGSVSGTLSDFALADATLVDAINSNINFTDTNIGDSDGGYFEAEISSQDYEGMIGGQLYAFSGATANQWPEKIAGTFSIFNRMTETSYIGFFGTEVDATRRIGLDLFRNFQSATAAQFTRFGEGIEGIEGKEGIGSQAKLRSSNISNDLEKTALFEWFSDITDGKTFLRGVGTRIDSSGVDWIIPYTDLTPDTRKTNSPLNYVLDDVGHVDSNVFGIETILGNGDLLTINIYNSNGFDLAYEEVDLAADDVAMLDVALDTDFLLSDVGQETSLAGSLNGRAGAYTCTATVTVECGLEAHANGGTVTTGNWRFIPGQPELSDDYLVGGVWIRLPDLSGGVSGREHEYEVGAAIAGNSSLNLISSTDARYTAFTELTGSATYTGGAAGMMLRFDGEKHTVHEFAGTSTFTVDFGSATQLGTASGSVRLRDTLDLSSVHPQTDSTFAEYVITLEEASHDSGDATKGFSGSVGRDITSHGGFFGGDGTGRWGGFLLNPIDGSLPRSIAGTFGWTQEGESNNGEATTPFNSNNGPATAFMGVFFAHRADDNNDVFFQRLQLAGEVAALFAQEQDFSSAGSQPSVNVDITQTALTDSYTVTANNREIIDSATFGSAGDENLTGNLVDTNIRGYSRRQTVDARQQLTNFYFADGTSGSNPPLFSAETNWLAGGAWMNLPAAGESGKMEVGAFFDGTSAYRYAANGIAALTGNASYTGFAGGLYSYHQTPDDDGNYGGIGSFGADVALQALFGSDTDAGSVSGTITQFTIDSDTLDSDHFEDLTLTLENAEIDASVAGGGFSGSVSTTDEAYRGGWNAEMFGTGTDNPARIGGSFGATRSEPDADGIRATFVGTIITDLQAAP